jgi:hypothetical protein
MVRRLHPASLGPCPQRWRSAVCGLLVGLASAGGAVRAAPPEAGPPFAAPAVPALRLDFSATNHRLLERRLRQVQVLGLDLPGDPAQLSLGLEFSHPELRERLNGLLGVQLDDGSLLQFRVRGRGLGLSYRTEF